MPVTGRPYLAIPGPSVMPDRVLCAMHQASPNIYEGDLVDMVAGLWPDLRELAGTKAHVAAYIANGHGTWEAANTNLFSRGDKALILATGTFGHGWANSVRGLGVEVDVLDFGRSVAPDWAQVEQALRAQPNYKAVLATHVDTASSVKTDIPGLRAVMDAVGHSALLAVDCVASLGCDPFLMDDGTEIDQVPLLRKLVPSQAVVDRMRSVKPWSTPAVGLMIRANSLAHTDTKLTSPPGWFYARMAQFRSADPEVPFFLSTDSPEVSEYVHRTFGGVHELAAKGAYNSKAGLIDAAADLYLLAGTTYILGSHSSSFSETACYLSGHLGYETSQRTPAETWHERRLVMTVPQFFDR